MKLTIFTPTYNREKYLKKLYDSLLNQTNKNFNWIIVDDGSTDDTEKVVKGFIKQKKIKIKYFKQKNSGKHIAHNKGVKECNTELFFCVDSDDYLTNDAVQLILSLWESNNNNNTGIIALRGYFDGKVMGNEIPRNIKQSTLSDLYYMYGKKGETALIFKTEYLKKNLFPKFDGEKFLSEEFIYNRIDKIGKMIILNKVIYKMEYLEEGLTKNYIKMWKSSPKGVISLLNSRYDVSRNLLGIRKYYRCIRVILILNAFCISKNISINKNTPNKFLSNTLLLPSFFISKIKFK